MFYIIIILIAFAIYVIYTHAEITDKDGNTTRESVIISPKSVATEAADLAGLLGGTSVQLGKRSIEWTADRNALAEASFQSSGWATSKGFAKGYDRGTTLANNISDFSFDDEPKQPVKA